MYVVIIMNIFLLLLLLFLHAFTLLVKIIVILLLVLASLEGKQAAHDGKWKVLILIKKYTAKITTSLHQAKLIVVYRSIFFSDKGVIILIHQLSTLGKN